MLLAASVDVTEVRLSFYTNYRWIEIGDSLFGGIPPFSPKLPYLIHTNHIMC